MNPRAVPVLFGAICLGALLIRRGVRWRLPSADLLTEFFTYGFWVYIGNMGATFSQRIDQYFVKQVSVAPGAFGVYNLATSLTNRTRIFPQALSRSAYARLCSSELREAAELTAACFRQMLALGILLCAIGSLAAPLIPFIYSAEFAAAVLPFIIFLFGKLFQNCSWMLANFFSGHLARPRTPMLVNWLLLPLQGAGAYFAMLWGGLIAVAIIASLGYALQFLVFLILFLRAQPHVGLSRLFLIGKDDITPWQRLLKRTPPSPRSSSSSSS